MLNKNYVKSGIVSGLAFLTRINSLLSSASLFVFSYVGKKWRKYMRGVLIFSPLFVLLLLVPNFFFDTLWYHLAKTALPSWKSAELGLFFMEQYALLIAFAITLVPVIKYKYYKKPIIQISLLNIVFNLAYFLITSTFFIHYFVFLVPFVCIIVGYLLIELYGKSKVLGAVLLLVVVSLSVWEVSRLQKYVNPAYFTLENIMYTDSVPSDMITDFSVSTIPNYLAFVTGRRIPLDYIDSSFQRIEKYVNMSDFLEEVKESKFVLWNLRNSPYLLHEGYDKVAEYIRENFYPRYIYFEVGDIFILWERGSQVPIYEEPVFEGKYKTKYLKAYVNNSGYYGYIHPELYPGSVYPRYDCIPCLVNVTGDTSIDYGSRIVDIGNNQTLAYIKFESEANYGGLRLLAKNHQFIELRESRWSTSNGSLVSESWITSHTENYTEILTLTRVGESIRSLVFVQYSNPRRKYVYLAGYQLIEGFFVEIYKERID
jgi:hypothetical protein